MFTTFARLLSIAFYLALLTRCASLVDTTTLPGRSPFFHGKNASFGDLITFIELKVTEHCAVRSTIYKKHEW